MGTGKRRSAEQIQRALREADRDLAKGLVVGDVCRKLGVTPTTYYRWRQRFDPAEVDDARRFPNWRWRSTASSGWSSS